jgi:hypothetical protein
MEWVLGLVLTVVALTLLRDALNRHLIQYLLLVIRNEKVTTLIFALLFFPGVVLHELSHWLMAKLLLVKTHRFSLFPTWEKGGTFRFGFVELSKTDKIRTALIGLAPLVTGILVILWIAFSHLHLEVVLEGVTQFDLDTILDGIKTYLKAPDVFLWSYLLLSVSNTMLPSKSDRKAWLPAVLGFVVIYIAILGISMGSPASLWMVDIARELGKTLIKAFGIAAVLNLLILLPLWLIDVTMKRIQG